MSKKPINIAIIGLGFGAEFIPIYQKHPLANMYAICQRNKEKAEEIGKAFGIEKVYTDYDELLKDPSIDAVHINTPIQNHAEQSIKALKAGKHVACTVPMATTVDECRQIVELTQQTGLTYMMMETVIYSREFLFVKEMYEKGDLGKIQFLRASHQQEMAGWPGYWEGLPPMHYATHCVGPVLALPKGQAEYVSCLGSGRIDEALIPKYGSPFAIETCHIKLKDSDLADEVNGLKSRIMLTCYQPKLLLLRSKVYMTQTTTSTSPLFKDQVMEVLTHISYMSFLPHLRKIELPTQMQLSLPTSPV